MSSSKKYLLILFTIAISLLIHINNTHAQSCPLVYEPVCGTDGNTYSNSCTAGVAGVSSKCEGECPCDGDVDEQILDPDPTIEDLPNNTTEDQVPSYPMESQEEETILDDNQAPQTSEETQRGPLEKALIAGSVIVLIVDAILTIYLLWRKRKPKKDLVYTPSPADKQPISNTAG